MNINPAGSPPKSGVGSREEQSGLTTRMESAAKLKVPPPKGKGVVMLILAAAVVAAMIWDFTGRGAASRAVKRSVSQNERPVAPKDPNAPKEDVGSQPTPPAAGSTISVQTGGVALEVTPEAALALFNSNPEAGEKREAMRLSILEALVKPAGRRDALARQCFEAAAWLIDGAGPDAQGPLSQLALRALAALRNDTTATAATLFLARLPDSGGAITATALDEVIGDPQRPLEVRVAAARVRPKAGRPALIEALAKNPSTHPALREALGK